MKTRKELAIEYINKIRLMSTEDLVKILQDDIGEDVANFFLHYSSNLITKEPDRVLQNCSSLMALGYLIRVSEERQAMNPFQQPMASA